MKKLGLILSGGGIRGLAHIGLLEVLEAHDIQPYGIAGVSAGAIVGALYAGGCSPAQVRQFWKEENPFSLDHFTWRKPGLIDAEKLADSFEKYLPEDDFSALRCKLWVAATDLVSGKLRLFSEGPLIKPVLASAAFPLIFSPVEIEGKLYQDGGILNNFPYEPLLYTCDVLIGMNISPMRKVDRKDLDSTFDIGQRVIELGIDTGVRERMAKCDVVIVPEALVEVGTFDLGAMDRAYEIGKAAVEEKIEEIVAVLKE
jgi:NTE family protein